MYGRTHPQGVIPSCCCVWPRGLGVAVELGQSGALGMVTYNRRVFLGSSGGVAMLNRDARARRQAPPRATLWRSLGLRVEGTAPAGGWIRRRRRISTGRRRTGKRRVELSLKHFFVFRSAPQAAWSILCFFETGQKGNRLELRVDERKCEGAGRVS